jgi:hypothetical protein
LFGDADTVETPFREADRTLGEAANRYVSLQVVMSIIGFIIFLIILFGVILPQMSSQHATFQFSPR